MRHPLQLAVTSMWTLGGLYFSAGGVVAAYVVAYDGVSARNALVAVLALLPGTAYLFAASAARRGYRWVLIATAVCTALAGIGLLFLLARAVMSIGLADLLRPRALAPPAVVVILLLLAAYHFRLVYQVSRARGAAGSSVEPRGFDPITSTHSD